MRPATGSIARQQSPAPCLHGIPIPDQQRCDICHQGRSSSQSAIDYFTTKKSATLGDFAENIAKTAEYLQKLAPHLAALEDLLQSESALNGQLSLEDIVVFPILRNLTCVKGISFPPKLATYVKKMAELSRVNLYFDTAI